MSQHPIGVFDSGVGGLSILRALRAEMPAEDFVYLADTGHAPYGERGDGYVIERTRAVVRQLRDEHAVKALVIACNTATAAAIHLVRNEHPALLTIGVEPSLKPALASSRTRRIGVIATRGTLESAKLRLLHESLKHRAEFILQPCDGLADAIENDDAAAIGLLGAQYLGAIGPFGTQAGQVDTLVLGCTHYPFASKVLSALAGPGVRLIENGEPVARHTRTQLERAGLLRSSGGGGGVALAATGPLSSVALAARRWLDIDL